MLHETLFDYCLRFVHVVVSLHGWKSILTLNDCCWQNCDLYSWLEIGFGH
jgi:hypothetical protein